jgi:predicted enzyme related to lactoylglutathione lyase
MNQGLRLVVFPVADIAKATGLYRALLGVDPYYESAYYTGFRAGDLEVGLAHDQWKTGPGAIPYWQVDDIRESLQALVAAGGETKQDVTNVGNGLLIALVKDADGNIVGLRQSP